MPEAKAPTTAPATLPKAQRPLDRPQRRLDALFMFAVPRTVHALVRHRSRVKIVLQIEHAPALDPAQNEDPTPSLSGNSDAGELLRDGFNKDGHEHPRGSDDPLLESCVRPDEAFKLHEVACDVAFSLSLPCSMLTMRSGSCRSFGK